MDWITIAAPLVIRLLGLAKYAPAILKWIPYIVKYMPPLLAGIKTASDLIDRMKAEHPQLWAVLSSIAQKLFPGMPQTEAETITTLGLFRPRPMSKQEEMDWMDRRSNVGVSG